MDNAITHALCYKSGFVSRTLFDIKSIDNAKSDSPCRHIDFDIRGSIYL
jgi:hypothetical protein